MQALPSRLVSLEEDWVPANGYLRELGFSLGGNWDYDRGSFDRPLDEARLVWLRLPFEVMHGRLDAEADGAGTRIRFGQPYVLKHIYNAGLDEEAQPRALGGLIDQFASPVDPDAELEPRWTEQAEQWLRQVEQRYPQ